MGLERREDEKVGVSGGRFVPTADRILPPMREVSIQRVSWPQDPYISKEPGVDMPYHFGAISGFGNGGMSITDAWVTSGASGGVRLPTPAKVAVGDTFTIHVAFSANNGAGGWVAAWTICVTCIDSTRTLYNWKQHNSTFTGPGTISASNLALNQLSDMVMPDRDLSFTIKGFGTDNYTLFGNLTPPPMNLW